MAVPRIEQRVAALEAAVAQLRLELEAVTKAPSPWWKEIYGTFANDLLYEEATRLGREYRESLRPKPRSKQSKRGKSAKARKR